MDGDNKADQSQDANQGLSADEIAEQQARLMEEKMAAAGGAKKTGKTGKTKVIFDSADFYKEKDEKEHSQKK